MRYVIYVPGMTISSDILENKSLGGSESSGFYLARELAKKDRVDLFTNIQKEETYQNVNLIPIGQRSDVYKLGENFEKIASTIPFDVLISQRIPAAFYRKYNNKVNLYWLHDLSIVRNRDGIRSTLWNCDSILTVSEFHRQQVIDNIGLPDDFVHICKNAVSEHFTSRISAEAKWKGKNIIYTSRPERGLENALDVMDKLYKTDTDITLHVCGYDNTTQQLARYYQSLWIRCKNMPNVYLHGPLNKQELSNLFSSCFFHFYPVIESFEEVSCISAMEAQCSGTPVLAPKNGALPETLKDGGVQFIDNYDNEVYLYWLQEYSRDFNKWKKLYDKCKSDYNWRESAGRVEELVLCVLSNSSKNPARLIKHFLHHSDYFAARKIAKKFQIKHPDLKLYDFVETGKYKELYENISQYCIDDNNFHNIGNDQAVLGLPRFNKLLPYVNEFNNIGNCKVLDYGCCIGQLTVSLAKNFKNLEYYGVDVSQKNIDQANKYIQENKINNIVYSTVIPKIKFDLIIASEIVEHLPEPWKLVDMLESFLTEIGKVVLTFPYGPVESLRYGRFPYREHIHHFEFDDIIDLWGKKKNVHISQFSWNESGPNGEAVGGTLVSWDKSNVKSGKIDYDRKFNKQNPLQTLSVCIICRWEERNKGLRKTLDSIKDIADEIIIGFDCPNDFGNPPFFELGSSDFNDLKKDYDIKDFILQNKPLIDGFDEARNETIKRATCDWILWIDADEEMAYSERLTKYLRNSPFQGYSVKQHHFSSEPLEILKTDLPLRLFRKDTGFKFFGVVHEHPSIDPDTAPKHAMICNDFWINHLSYSTERARRERFQRNIGLMKKDREKYPVRSLGDFLWIRDLIHLCQFKLERIKTVDQEIKNYAIEALKIWRELIDKKHLRYIIESFPYISSASGIVNGENTIKLKFSIQSSKLGINCGDSKVFEIVVPDSKDAKNLMNLIVNENLNVYEDKYF